MAKVSRRSMVVGIGTLVGTGALGSVLVGCGATATSQPTAVVAESTAAEQATTATQEPAATEAAVEEATAVEEIVARPAPEGVSKTIKLSVWGDVTDLQIYSGIADAFHSSQSEIGVTLEQWVGEYYQKMQTQIAAAVEPDLIYAQGWYWQTFAERGVLRTYDDFMAVDLPDYMAEAWPESADPQTKMDGKTYLAVSDGGSMVMLCAKGPFDRAGVDFPPKSDWTIEEFTDTVQKLTGTFDGVEQWGYQAQASYERLAPFIRLDGALEWDKVVDPTKALFDTKAVTDAIQLWVGDLVNEYGVSPSPAMMQGGTNTIQTGNVAIKYEGPWFLANMWGDKASMEGGTPFEAVPVPRGSAGSICSGFLHGHVMSSRTAEPEACWELVKFVGSDAGQEQVTLGGRQPHSARAIREVWLPVVQKQYNFTTAEAFATGWETGVVHVISGTTSRLVDEGIAPALDSVINGRRTAEEAFASANVDIQTVLDEYWQDRAG